MTLPQDPVILLSYINTQLRDQYASLDDLCLSLVVERRDVEEKLAAIHYHYDEERRSFV